MAPGVGEIIFVLFLSFFLKDKNQTCVFTFLSWWLLVGCWLWWFYVLLHFSTILLAEKSIYWRFVVKLSIDLSCCTRLDRRWLCGCRWRWRHDRLLLRCLLAGRRRGLWPARCGRWIRDRKEGTNATLGRLNAEERTDNMYSCLLICGRGGSVLGQLDDAAGNALELAHILSTLANDASDLERYLHWITATWTAWHCDSHLWTWH